MKQEMLVMKAQLDENTHITKAIHHRQVETDAQLESISLDVSNIKEDINSLKEMTDKTKY